jgi:hypothetical protein|tara:strand:- start:515 stop:949 length:435 start_codon:yes stop_codon:yes gene_type:complete
MGFKLGTERGNYAVSGEIKTKMRFSRESGDQDVSVPGTPIVRVPLEEGVLGEANMDGTIYINDQMIPGSFQERQTINHEMRHATDIKIGKLEYGDYHIKWNGETFRRETINGMDMILVDGEWKEAGSHDFPWEQEANTGNGNAI